MVCLSPRFRGVYSSTRIVPESCDVCLSHRFTGSTAKRLFHESVYWFAHPLFRGAYSFPPRVHVHAWVCLSPRFRGAYSARYPRGLLSWVYSSPRFRGAAVTSIGTSNCVFAHPLGLEGPTARVLYCVAPNRFAYPLGLEGPTSSPSLPTTTPLLQQYLTLYPI